VTNFSHFSKKKHTHTLEIIFQCKMCVFQDNNNNNNNNNKFQFLLKRKLKFEEKKKKRRQ